MSGDETECWLFCADLVPKITNMATHDYIYALKLCMVRAWLMGCMTWTDKLVWLDLVPQIELQINCRHVIYMEHQINCRLMINIYGALFILHETLIVMHDDLYGKICMTS
jgi:hypothetical protein